MVYESREAAGQTLARKLDYLKGSEPVVLAIPRGGVLVGAAVARRLGAPIGLALVRKIFHPGFYEYPIGAIAKDQLPVFNPIEYEAINKDWLDREVRMARLALDHRDLIYHQHRSSLVPVKDKTVILVDDSFSTGYAMAAAYSQILRRHPSRIILASPVATFESLKVFRSLDAQTEFLGRPTRTNGSASRYYRRFCHLNDSHIKEIIREVNYDIVQESIQI